MDNRNNNCPALMSDGRLCTNYYDNEIFNQTIRMMNKKEDNHDYRIFLQKNASELISRERAHLLKENTCHETCGKK